MPESPSVSSHTLCNTRSLASGPDTKDNRILRKLSIARAIPLRILREKAHFRLLFDRFRFLAEQREPGKTIQVSSALIGELCLFLLFLSSI